MIIAPTRWDQQRLRQELQLQKLRARQEQRAAAKISSTTTSTVGISLLPALEEATHIAVEEAVVVAAWGRPLPELLPQPFSLPWL